ncbi:universal stress protein [Mycobacterium hodleri]|uniref:universal stress protein n=1 Tax=Mycolicibacterium hodleri TaxID=49897 RepID=UPI0021F37E1C|nr:universal stress protein [Mycolicibacterium hodleri]MCV7137034.1 universal stress protein [Mycolicibacterium hodleri]
MTAAPPERPWDMDFGTRHMDLPEGDVVVGVNRSMGARAAASWAAIEASGRGVAVRLVAVIRDDHERPQAEESLRCARASVENQAPATCVDEVIRYGETRDVLVEESRGAAMICLGTSHRAGSPLEADVVAIVERASCSVAVIRPEDFTGAGHSGVVSVVLDDDPGNDAVVAQAMREGRLRNAVVRQVDHRLDSWVRRFPDVTVEIVADGMGRRPGCTDDRRPTQLAVLPKADTAHLSGLASSSYHPIQGCPDHSMLFVASDVERATRT